MIETRDKKGDTEIYQVIVEGDDTRMEQLFEHLKDLGYECCLDSNVPEKDSIKECCKMGVD